MTRILIVKMSALGDILHTLPAVTDALKHDLSLQIDWLCEEPFADIARLHPGLHQVIPHGRLRWKKRRLAFVTLKEQWQFYRGLRRNQYDLVIDAQGRIKSARVGWLSGAPVFGPDEQSATDAETRHVYRQRYPITEVNAIERTRELFGKVLGYQPQGEPDFGIQTSRLASCQASWHDQLIFFHGTTWDSKHWPERQWCELLQLARQAGQKVLLPWGNDTEKQRAEHLVASSGWGEVLPHMSLWDLSGVIARCKGAVGVDTGLMHVAAGIGIPTVAIFGSTSVALTGAMGSRVVNFQADFECSPCRQKICLMLLDNISPCYSTISATKVWSELLILAEKRV